MQRITIPLIISLTVLTAAPLRLSVCLRRKKENDITHHINFFEGGQ